MGDKSSRVAIVDGRRTPFLRSGTGFRPLMAWQLGQSAVQGLLTSVGIPFSEVDAVIMGCVATDIATTNVAREIVLGTGLPVHIPAHTCTQACVSANQAIASAANTILAGKADVVIAGGTETFSDTDIRVSRKYRNFLLDMTMFNRPKSLRDWLRLLGKMRPADFIVPERPAIAEYSTGLTMGASADRLTKRLGVSRERQDAFACASHERAVSAQQQGLFKQEIAPVVVNGTAYDADNGPRTDTRLDKLASLRPSFDRRYGTATAGNSSFLTDGAAAVLLMSEEKVQALDLEPMGYLCHYTFSGQDPVEELLLGPAYSTSKLLSEADLELGDIGVFEMHEAFAGQVLANLDCMASESFAREKLGRGAAMGSIDSEALNRHGGSLSIGHPFGATGARLVTTCCRRLQAEKERYGLVAACAAGGLGSAMLLENPSFSN